MKLRTIPALIVLLASPATQAFSLPDLTITDLTVNGQCQPVITVRNLGPGNLPDKAMYVGYSPGLSLRKDGSPVGNAIMDKAELVPAGGSYTYTDTHPDHVVIGQANYVAVIDDSSIIPEASETNNSLSKTLNCTPSQPDLTIDQMQIDNECRVSMTIRNIGQSDMSSTNYGVTTLERTIDGEPKGSISLSGIDGAAQAAVKGGSVTWTDAQEFQPTSDARYNLSTPAGSDANPGNNGRSIIVPDRCKAAPSEGHHDGDDYLWQPDIQPITPMRPARPIRPSPK